MKLLVPVDKSRRDGIALPYATHMAKALDASIAILHALPITRTLVPNAVRGAEAYVSAVEVGLREDGIDAKGIVRRGDSANIIVAVADELKVDLILMTTRGRSSLGKLVLGSIADAVLSRCQAPVLLLSEALNGANNMDQGMRLKSLYLAAVVWDRKVRGLCTGEEAKRELDRLATMGLDHKTLHATYEAHEQQGTPYEWIDIDFQLEALREFLPESIDSLLGKAPRPGLNQAA